MDQKNLYHTTLRGLDAPYILYSNITRSPEPCFNCGYIITEPVCEFCYLKEVRSQLSEITLDKELKKKIIDKVKNSFGDAFLNETECIVCGNEIVTICSHCFFSKLKEIIGDCKSKTNGEEKFEKVFDNFLYKCHGFLGV